MSGSGMASKADVRSRHQPADERGRDDEHYAHQPEESPCRVIRPRLAPVLSRNSCAGIRALRRERAATVLTLSHLSNLSTTLALTSPGVERHRPSRRAKGSHDIAPDRTV